MAFVITLLFFAACMTGLSIGMIVSGRRLKGSCGGIAELEHEDLSCGGCAKREAEVCPTEDPMVALALRQYPNPRDDH